MASKKRSRIPKIPRGFKFETEQQMAERIANSKKKVVFNETGPLTEFEKRQVERQVKEKRNTDGSFETVHHNNSIFDDELGLIPDEPESMFPKPKEEEEE